MLLALSACGPGPLAEPATAGACPITTPIRLAAAPEGFEPAEDVWYGLTIIGDDILFTFDHFDDPDRQYWRLNRCTGDIEPFSSLAPGLHNPYVIETPQGRLLHGNDADGRPFVLDRFDVAGDDDPRPVPGLPEAAQPAFWMPPESLYTKYVLSGPGKKIFYGAGVGAWTFAVYTHHGDLEVPAVKISDTLLAARDLDASHILVHEDSGEVHRVDALSGAREHLISGARYVNYDHGGRRFIWQAMGDDIAEPVYMHDLDTGDDVQIAINDFAARSWNRDPDDRDLGQWEFTRDIAAAAMIGPGERFVTAVRADTGEPVPIPEHVGVQGSIAGYFMLSLAGDTDEVQALWDPLAGDVREWYRGDARTADLRTVEGDRAEYSVTDPTDPSRGSLWRVDLGTGEATEILADFSSAYPLDDSHYLLGFSHGGIEAPPAGLGIYLALDVRDIELVDIASGVRTPIADGISASRIMPGEGLIYLDAHGPDPGVWAYPLPH